MGAALDDRPQHRGHARRLVDASIEEGVGVLRRNLVAVTLSYGAGYPDRPHTRGDQPARQAAVVRRGVQRWIDQYDVHTPAVRQCSFITTPASRAGPRPSAPTRP